MTTRDNPLKRSLIGMQDAAPQPATVTALPTQQRLAQSAIAPSRVGKRVVSGYFDPTAFRQIKLLCVERDITVQDVLAEALNDLFRKYGKSPIA